MRCEANGKNDIRYLCLPSGLCGSTGRFCGIVEKGVNVFGVSHISAMERLMWGF